MQAAHSSMSRHSSPVSLPSIHEILPGYLGPGSSPLSNPAHRGKHVQGSDVHVHQMQAFVGTQNRRHSPSISLASLGDLLRTDGAGGSSDCLALTIPRYEMCAPAQLELPSMSPPTDLRRTDDDKKHACPWCGKRFDRPSSLSIHINTHTGDKPFMCAYPGCGRRFNVNSNMRRHYRNHSSPVARQSGTPALSDTLPTPPWDPVYFPKFAAPASRVPSHRPTPIPDAHDYEFEEDSHSDDDPGYRREEAL